MQFHHQPAMSSIWVPSRRTLHRLSTSARAVRRPCTSHSRPLLRFVHKRGKKKKKCNPVTLKESSVNTITTAHRPTGPDPSLDLISLYGLGPIAASVARMDPNTGEKINRLRKSYEGKLKGLGLAGRNKPVKHEPSAPGGLIQLTMWPDEEWQNQKVTGKEIKVADTDSALHDMQMRAMKMEPGAVPNNDFWDDVLGHEKPSKYAGVGDVGKKATDPSGASRPGTQPNGAIAAEPERTRPSRGRKRNYDDSSFVGYGEGYADDDDDAGFYSNSESAGKKKRKKV